jgi:hypothetical protein
MESLLNLAGEVFGVSGDKLGVLASAICENVELSSLLASSDGVTGREKPKRVSDVSRCEALVWMLERDDSGVWVPKRCTRGCVEGDAFCKNHGARVSKRCDDCSSFQGCEVVHEFKHEHLGTIFGRSFVIDKFWEVLVKKSKAACCVKDGSSSSSSSDVVCGELFEKRSSSSSKKLVVPSEKLRRVVDNPFMNWLSFHRGEIKAGLLSEGVVSGRELTTLVSKRGGEMWRVLSNEQQQEWKGKKVLSVVNCDDVVPSDDTVSSVVVDADEVCLVFNKEHSVWVDDDTGLYYGVNDVESAPLGQFSGGKLVAFKKSVSKK